MLRFFLFGWQETTARGRNKATGQKKMYRESFPHIPRELS
jgi:hypothetical protein